MPEVSVMEARSTTKDNTPIRGSLAPAGADGRMARRDIEPAAVDKRWTRCELSVDSFFLDGR
jgi:hypothetical protein